jgi:glycosyltransferase involved in cell wall biosynthesis
MMGRSRRAIFLTKNLPYPADSGGRLRSGALVDVFRERFDEVHVLGFGAAPEPELVPVGVTVHAVEHADAPRGTLRARSVAMGRWYHPRLKGAVEALRRPDTYVHVDFVQMAVNLPSLDVLDSLDMHNVESDLLAQRSRADTRFLQRNVLRVESGRLRAWERKAAAHASITCCSVADEERLRDLGIKVEAVALNGATIPRELPPPPPSPHFVFVGTLNWQPNVEGLLWFVNSVWPLVIKARPQATVSIVGREPTETLRQALNVPGVTLAADVPAVAPYYQEAWSGICPLLTGGGSRLKIVEATAHGRPVVSTTLGAEGLEGLVGHGVVLADAPEAFAETLIRLADNPTMAAELGQQAREAAKQNWSWESTLSPFAKVLDERLESR